MPSSRIDQQLRRVVRKGGDPYVVKVPCWPCINLQCNACFNLNLQTGSSYSVSHCLKHCRHKKSHSKIKVGKGVDNQYGGKT